MFISLIRNFFKYQIGKKIEKKQDSLQIYETASKLKNVEMVVIFKSRKKTKVHLIK
jgi:hypothetical protein